MGQPPEVVTQTSEKSPARNAIRSRANEKAVSVSRELVETIQHEARKHANSRPLKLAKRVIIIAVGSTVLAFGVVLLVLPGPAIVVIPSGLAILALEFAWARRWLRRSKRILQDPKSELKRLNPFNTGQHSSCNAPDE